LAVELGVGVLLLLEIVELLLVEEEEHDDLEDEHAEDDEQPALAGLRPYRGAAGAALLGKQVYANHRRLSRSFRIASPRATLNCAAGDWSSDVLTSLASIATRSRGWSPSTGTRERRPTACGSAGRLLEPPVR